MRRLALAIAYDGTRFDSYARQPGRRTVESELLATLAGAGILKDAATARFRSGSRTDRGVSAAWNVVAFDSEAAAGAVVAAGRGAPEGLVLLSAAETVPGFDPRHARRRVYWYFLARPWAWPKVAAAAAMFVGEHDFSNFRRADADKPPRAHVRAVRYRARAPGPLIEVEGDAFLWHQVRRMVAALERVEAGDITPTEIARALGEPARRIDLGLAPAEDLLLRRVDYDGIAFPPPSPATRDRLGRIAADARRRAAWAETLVRGTGPRTRR